MCIVPKAGTNNSLQQVLAAPSDVYSNPDRTELYSTDPNRQLSGSDPNNKFAGMQQQAWQQNAPIAPAAQTYNNLGSGQDLAGAGQMQAKPAANQQAQPAAPMPSPVATPVVNPAALGGLADTTITSYSDYANPDRNRRNSSLSIGGGGGAGTGVNV